MNLANAIQKVEDLFSEENTYFLNSSKPQMIDFYAYPFLARIYMFKGSCKEDWVAKIGLEKFPKIERFVKAI